MSRALVDIVDAAFDAGRRHDRQQLEILKTETMAAASKIASDTVEDPPDPESGYSNIKPELDADRLFWNYEVCRGYCRAMNIKEIDERRMMPDGNLH